MASLKIAAIQTNTIWHDAAANRRRAGHHLASITQSSQAEVIVLPEMFSTGFTMDAVEQAESMSGPTVEWLREQALKLNVALCTSLIIEESGHFYNRMLWLASDGAIQSYDKKHLFAIAGEDRDFTAGTSIVNVRHGDWKIRLSVCYDLRFPVWLRQGTRPYDILFNVANWPSPRHNAWDTLLRARAMENLAFVVGVNRVGADAYGHRYLGGSCILDAKGHSLAEADDQETTIVADLSMDELQRFRKKFPVDQDADAFNFA